MFKDAIAFIRAANRKRLDTRKNKHQVWNNKDLFEAGRQLGQALGRTNGMPVLVVSYNNGVYVQNTVRQLNQLGIVPIVLDNASTDAQTLSTLKGMASNKSAQVIRCHRNHGHLVGFMEPVYRQLPNIFAYTDPDLQFHGQLPADFLSTLEALTHQYGVYKVGFALTLEFDQQRAQTATTQKMSSKKPFIFDAEYEVNEWESQFWLKRLHHPQLEIYSAPLDTTFAVYNKANYRGDLINNALRVAGPFTAIHLPWFPHADIMSASQRAIYQQGNISSTWHPPEPIDSSSPIESA